LSSSSSSSSKRASLFVASCWTFDRGPVITKRDDDYVGRFTLKRVRWIWQQESLGSSVGVVKIKKVNKDKEKPKRKTTSNPPPIGQVLRRRCWRKNQISKKKKKKNPKMRRRANGTVRYWARVRGYIFKRRKIYTTTTTHRTRRRRRRRRKNDDRVYKI
jgi:hypothetical protein